MPAAAAAQEDGAGLDAPPAGVRHRARTSHPRSVSASGARSEEVLAPASTAPWSGPRVFFGYGFYRLTDGHGQGQVHAGQFGGYAPLRRFRLGLYGELGARRYALGSDDLLFRGAVEAGYQHLPGWGPLVPYAAVEASAGVVIERRFSTTRSERLLGLGLVVGADLRVVQSLHVGLSFGYVRMGVGDLAHDVWLLRVRFGL